MHPTPGFVEEDGDIPANSDPSGGASSNFQEISSRKVLLNVVLLSNIPRIRKILSYIHVCIKRDISLWRLLNACQCQTGPSHNELTKGESIEKSN